MLLKYLLLSFLFGYLKAEYRALNSMSTQCPRPDIDNGRVRYRQRKIAKFVCHLGYELVGNRYGTCVYGAWDVPTPVCVKPGCPELPSLENGLQISAHHGAWVVNFCAPGYELIGSTAIYCNGYNWNSTVSPHCVKIVKVTESQKHKLTCDFEDASLCGWEQDDQHDFDWLRINRNKSVLYHIVPISDHTYGEGKLGHFMYIQSVYNRRENDTARLLSPIYDSTYSVDGCFSLHYILNGRGLGGLRVYQKPDSLLLHTMLEMPDAEKENYILFEKWGNFGLTWYQAVGKLKKLNEDFQIVIEGIRGSVYLSAIAVDDVALMQGENCTVAKDAATEPQIEGSCQGRCDQTTPVCDCTMSCTDNFTCCPDYVEACFIDPIMPQTAELVGESSSTTQMASTTTSRTSRRPTVTYTTSTTTERPTTTSTSTTTSTTTTTTPKTTTIRTTTSTTTPKPTTKVTTTTKKVITTTKKPITTKVEPTTTIKATTTMKPKPTMIIKMATDAGDKIDDFDEIEPDVTTYKKVVEIARKDNSGPLKTTIITVVVLSLCACLLYVGIAYRGSRGLLTLNRLRGRVSNNSEVRYLTSNEDDL